MATSNGAVRIDPGRISLERLRNIARDGVSVRVDDAARQRVEASQTTVSQIVDSGDVVYGVNTGFGKMAQVRIPAEQLSDLQKNLVISHSIGTGPLLKDATIRLILVLKMASLARGYSGVRWQIIAALERLVEADVLPCVPAKGPVGASGDLAPLAYIAVALIGIGQVRHQGQTMHAAAGLKRANLEPLTLGPKEGLALLNGTQVSTALALEGLFAAEDNLNAAVIIGAMTVDAVKGSGTPFDKRIQEVRGQRGQITAARAYRNLLSGSRIRESHINCDRVQDPYSLRCQPQVIGACLDHLTFAADIISRESNAVSDNPLVFAEDNEILSG